MPSNSVIPTSPRARSPRQSQMSITTTNPPSSPRNASSPPRSPPPPPRSPRSPRTPRATGPLISPAATPTLGSFPSFSSGISWESPLSNGLGISFGGNGPPGSPNVNGSSNGNSRRSPRSPRFNHKQPSHHRPRMRLVAQYLVFVLVVGGALALLVVMPSISGESKEVIGGRPARKGGPSPYVSKFGSERFDRNRYDEFSGLADDVDQDLSSSASSSSWTTLAGIRFYSPTYLLRAASSLRQRLRSTSSRNLYADVSFLPKSWIAGKDYKRPLHLVLGKDGQPMRDVDGEVMREEDHQAAYEEEKEGGQNVGSGWRSWRGAVDWISDRLPGGGKSSREDFNRDSDTSSRDHDARYGHTSWSSLDPSIREFREWEYARAVQHAGTGDRVMRFLEKARSGKGFTVSVVGGSVSKGRGLPPWKGGEDPEAFAVASTGSTPTTKSTDKRGERIRRRRRQFHTDKREPSHEFQIDRSPEISRNLYHPLNLHHQVFSFLNATFPAEGPQSAPNLFVNGAQGGVGSDYFAGCWKEHIPEDSDLVLVELGINDERDLSAMEDFEHLLRSLIEMRSHPAVIVVQTFTLLFPTLSQASSLHTDVAAYYDVPVLALRDVLLPRLLNDPSVIPDTTSSKPSSTVGDEVRKWFRNVPSSQIMPGDAKVVDGVDLMHISHHGHTLIADLLIHHLELQINNLQPYDAYLSVAGNDNDDDTSDPDAQVFQGTDVPAMLLASPYDPSRRMRRDDPFCLSTNSLFPARRLRTAATSSSHHKDASTDIPPISSSSDWEEWSWGEKRYIRSSTPGAQISFPIEIRAKPSRSSSTANVGEGYVRIGYQRSMTLGLGSVECWVDAGDHNASDEERFTERGFSAQGKHSAMVKDTATDESRERRGRRALVASDDASERSRKHPRKRLDGYWKIKERNKAVMTTIRDDLLLGRHTVTCQLLDDTADPGGGKEFRLVAVVHN